MTAPATLPPRERRQPVLLAVAIIAGLAFARALPEAAPHLSALVAPCAFVAMLGVMFELDPSRIQVALSRWRPTALALLLNALIAPLLALLVTRTFLHAAPDVALGLLLYLALPCTGWYLLFTRMAQGDLALGLGLLPWNLVLPVIVLPVYLPLLGLGPVWIDLTSIGRSVALFQLAPAFVALTLRVLARRLPAAARLQSAVYGSAKSGAFLLLVFSLFASQGGSLLGSGAVLASMAAPELLFFTAMAGLAWWWASRLSLKADQTTTLMFTATARNAEVAIALSAAAFGSTVAQATALAPMIELPVLILLLRAVVSRAPHRRTEP